MKKLLVVFVLTLPMALQFCSTTKKSKNALVTPRVTYMPDIQATILGNCSPCHIPPKGSKKALDNYDSVKLNIDEIIARIQKQPGEKGFMPFKHDRLPDSTIMVFVNWKKDGMPEN